MPKSHAIIYPDHVLQEGSQYAAVEQDTLGQHEAHYERESDYANNHHTFVKKKTHDPKHNEKVHHKKVRSFVCGLKINSIIAKLEASTTLSLLYF